MTSFHPAAPLQVDHLVVATSDLESAVDELAQRLGVRASPGGSHPGIATRNCLLSFSDTAYLEVIGPDPEQTPPDFPRPFGIDTLTASRLVTWAIGEHDLEGRIATACAAGYDPGEILPHSRQSPGGLIEWRLTRRAEYGGGGLVPFLIDWGTTPSPALSAQKGCTLVDLRGEHPDPAEVQRMLAALGVAMEVTEGQAPALIATLATPNGEIEIR